jgi:exosortase A-associated hydrolase 2
LSTPPETILEPFFLAGPHGRLFCVFQGPAAGMAQRGAVLLVPPFAEEMNKSRRQLFLQGRSLAAAGYAVLLADLSSTGDSEGEFADASWEKWLDDLLSAATWLRDRGAGRLTLLGLRLGALLAAELARRLPEPPNRMVLWQPVPSGSQHLDQFLRLRVAAAALGGGAGVTVRGLRESLARGESVEVAGYELTQSAVRELDARELAKIAPPHSVAVDWLELAHAPERGIGPGSERIVASWREQSVDVSVGVVAGEPFWSTAEITVMPALIEHTTRLIAGRA